MRRALSLQQLPPPQHRAAAAAVRRWMQQPPLHAHQQQQQQTRSIVMGCGSNVVDEFYPLRRFPKLGEKQYFSEETICASRVVGGVTLNHLVWARALGAPAGLMALQGADEKGEMIRQKLAEMGVDISAVRVSEEYATSVSHILTAADSPERTILMAPASTSKLTAATMEREFGFVLRTKASMVSTEISQVPLSGVLKLLELARQAGKPSLLDIDVTPEVALGPAKLGTKTELLACVTSATVAKLTADAAAEVLALVEPGAQLAGSLEGIAQQLAKALKARLCVVTDGGNGLGIALGSDEADGAVPPVFVPVFAGIAQVDTTGAGDAAFGGVIATLHAKGMPKDAAALERMGRVAAAAGAACVEVQGALPLPGKSARRMVELAPEARPFVEAAKALDIGLPHESGGNGSGGGGGGGLTVSPVVQAYAKSIQEDAKALRALSAGLLLQQKEEKLRRAVALIAEAHTDTASKGHVYTTGIGKSGLVAARLAASLRSISIRASNVPGNEWVHGDLGTMAQDDVLICLSHSGKTTELVDATRRVRARGGHVVAITGDPRSPLAQVADVHLHAAVTSEYLGKVPSRSIVVAEAIGNALVSAVSNATGLTVAKFHDNHPGGAIGGSRAAPA